MAENVNIGYLIKTRFIMGVAEEKNRVCGRKCQYWISNKNPVYYECGRKFQYWISNKNQIYYGLWEKISVLDI
ncbi:MAG: hypothetical protein WBA93_07170 [Microcoleaceae cyanobacterium]